MEASVPRLTGMGLDGPAVSCSKFLHKVRTSPKKSSEVSGVSLGHVTSSRVFQNAYDQSKAWANQVLFRLTTRSI